MQLQQCFQNHTNAPSARLYAQFQHPQQLRLQQEQQQSLVASGAWRSRTPTHAAEEHHEGLHFANGEAVPRSTGLAAYPASRLHDRYPHASNQRPCEQQQSYYHHPHDLHQQPDGRYQQGSPYRIQNLSQRMHAQFPSPTMPSTAMASSNLSPLPIPSSISTSCSSMAMASSMPLSANTRSVVGSPLSLPGIAKMLQNPSPGRHRSQSLSSCRSASTRSPFLRQGQASGDLLSLPYKRALETTPPSFIRPSASISCGGPQHSFVTAAAVPRKTARYLREMDRREILARIEQGETQAILAKEYQVSRAAICNLYKHREDVMRRKDTNPFSMHPKKTPKLKIRSSSSTDISRKLPSPRLRGTGGRDNGQRSNIHEVKSRAAALLLTRLRNKDANMSELRRSSERLVRLVLEEALALVPIKADDLGCEYSTCAISMERQAHGLLTPEDGSPLLDLFRQIEPHQLAARASVIEELDLHEEEEDVLTQDTHPNAKPKAYQVDLMDMHLLPVSLRYHNVFVFDVSATSADAICAVVRKLLERGAVEAMICIIVLFIDSEVIASVHKKHPSVRIVAAQIDLSGMSPLPSQVLER